MPVRFIPHRDLETLMAHLRLYGELHGPVRSEDGVVRFTQLTPGKVPDLAAVRTMLPPKKYLLHPRETILNFTPAVGYQLPTVETRPLILFGIHPCDLAGINYLDRIFLGEDPDPLYAARRAAMILIGASCYPDEFCSCHTFPSPLKALSDMFLISIEDGFAVTSSSPHGNELLEGMKEILAERDIDAGEDTRRFFDQGVPENPHSTLDTLISQWQEFAAHCLGCGACSLCCPTCACFDVMEFGGLDGCSAERVRSWDNCLFKSHAQVAGGTSFCKDKTERFRYRYQHKYHGFGKLLGIPACVGCGRCRVACPAALDLNSLLERVPGEQHE